MIDMLIQIPGPIFLIEFGLFSVGCIAIGRLWINFDGSTHYSLTKKITQFNPYELATLRSERNGIIETALVNLWHRQMLEITGEGRSARVKQLRSFHQSFENRIEEIVYHFAHITRQPKDFFDDTHLRSQLKPHIKPINQRLEKWHLKRTPAQLKQAWRKIGILLFILLSIGLTKLYFGLQYHHPVSFLVLLLIILPIIVVWYLKPHPNTTLGRRYQEQLTQHFEWLQSTNDEMNPALVVALFGVTALAGFEAFAPFEETFAQSTASSISSGDGGGSDGGGGCGGGGCGGCGG